MTGLLPAPSVAQVDFTVSTRGRGFTADSREVPDLVASSRVQTGMANVFTLHTNCSLSLSENANPAVRGDQERWFARAVPDGDPPFRHDAEGADDMPAPICAILTGVCLNLHVGGGVLQLGTWPGIYLWEHRHAPHQRKVIVTVPGATSA